MVPKLRFRIGRLAYLSENSVLRNFSEAADGIDELVLQREVISATVSGDLNAIVSMGPSAVQAASQPLVASGRSVTVGADKMSAIELQGIAAAVLNGVEITSGPESFIDHGILDLSRGLGIRSLKKSDSGFISEIAFLAGTDGGHSDLLSQAFDEDERLTFDAVERFEESAPHIT